MLVVDDGWTNGRVNGEAGAFGYFLGPYRQGDIFPIKTFDLSERGASGTSLRLSFFFYEIDSWDGNGAGGPDKFGVSLVGNQTDTIDFGWYHRTVEDEFTTTSTGALNAATGVSEQGLLQWSSRSISAAVIHEGVGSSEWEDQMHYMQIEIPSSFVADTNKMTVTFQFELQGDLDEAVGIDNVKLVSCPTGR